MPISARASRIGLPALRASITDSAEACDWSASASRCSSAARSPGVTARQAGNAAWARATAASSASASARGTCAITCSVAGSRTSIITDYKLAARLAALEHAAALVVRHDLVEQPLLGLAVVQIVLPDGLAEGVPRELAALPQLDRLAQRRGEGL